MLTGTEATTPTSVIPEGDLTENEMSIFIVGKIPFGDDMRRRL